MTNSGVLVEVNDGVAAVTLNRPAARNALDAATLVGLTAALSGVAADPGVEVVVVTGVDPAFCAGLDLAELSADPDHLMAVATAPSTNPWDALRALPQPVIGAVNGPAITGGFELALACDFLIASDRARFGDTHAQVGVLPAQGLPAALSAAVGVPTAKYLSLTGRTIDAAEAQRLGLVTQVVPHDQLAAAAAELAAAVMRGHGPSVRAVKHQYDTGLLGTRAEWLAREREEAGAWTFDPGLEGRTRRVRRDGSSAALSAGHR
jgi:enoyl-CoA hydratase